MFQRFLPAVLLATIMQSVLAAFVTFALTQVVVLQFSPHAVWQSRMWAGIGAGTVVAIIFAWREFRAVTRQARERVVS